MNLNCETILDFYTHKNRKVLCQIKVNAKSGKLKNSCRCLSQEHWKSFDKQLKKVITSVDDWSNGKCLKFVIKPYIHVKVQKSNLSLKHFYKCIGAIGGCNSGYDDEFADLVESNFVLECLFDFQLDVPFSSFIEAHEYEPNIETAQDGMSSNPLSYVPHKISNKKYESHDCDEQSNSSNPINEVVIKSQHKIKLTSSLGDSNISSNSDVQNIVLDKNENEGRSAKEDKSLRTIINTKYTKLQIQKHCVVEETTQRADTLSKNTEGPKSECVFSENLDRNITEKHAYKDQQLKRKEKHSDCDNKLTKKRSKILDEITAGFSVNMVVPIPMNKVEYMNEETNKELDKTDNIIVHKSKEMRNNIKAVTKISQKKLERSLSEDDIHVALRKQSKKSSITLSIGSENELEDGNKLSDNDNISNLNSSLSSVLGFTTDTPSQKLIQVERNVKESTEAINSLRRSERSPSKPKRLIDEQPGLLNKRENRKHKTSLKNKDRFGSDNHNYFENNNGENIKNHYKMKPSVFETPESKKTGQFNSSSSTKRNRNGDKSSSKCEQEKNVMSKWLSKKKIISLDKEATKLSKASTKSSSSKALPLKTSMKVKSLNADGNSEKRLKSVTPPPISLELPSKEELELIRNKTKLMQKENAKVRAELDKMRSPPPKEVEILSLQNIPVDDILNTFLTYKSELDEIYENNRKRDYIKGHDGINHCFVIRLLQQNTQMKMLQKLTDVYSNSKTTTQATLFANALLPEWIIRVYMEKFNFTRQQAIDQIKAQEEFQLHMEEQSDNSFMFD